MGYGFTHEQHYRRAYSYVRSNRLAQHFKGFKKEVKGTEATFTKGRQKFQVYLNKSPHASNGENFLYPVVNKQVGGKWKTIRGINQVWWATPVFWNLKRRN